MIRLPTRENPLPFTRPETESGASRKVRSAILASMVIGGAGWAMNTQAHAENPPAAVHIESMQRPTAILPRLHTPGRISLAVPAVPQKTFDEVAKNTGRLETYFSVPGETKPDVSRCSAFLIKAQNAAQPVQLVTAGHCLKDARHPDATITISHFTDNNGTRHSLHPSMINNASKTDVVRFSLPNGDTVANAAGLTLATTLPELGAPLFHISYPTLQDRLVAERSTVIAAGPTTIGSLNTEAASANMPTGSSGSVVTTMDGEVVGVTIQASEATSLTDNYINTLNVDPSYAGVAIQQRLAVPSLAIMDASTQIPVS